MIIMTYLTDLKKFIAKLDEQAADWVEIIEEEDPEQKIIGEDAYNSIVAIAGFASQAFEQLQERK